MARIYIAGPYTKGDPVLNTRRALEAGQQLMEAGHAPFVPHLTLFWNFLFPGSWEQWLTLDEEWVRVCQALVRLPGESAGADREVRLARSLGIPVFDGVEECLARLGSPLPVEPPEGFGCCGHR